MYGNKKNSHFIVALENNSSSMQPDETGVFFIAYKNCYQLISRFLVLVYCLLFRVVDDVAAISLHTVMLLF